MLSLCREEHQKRVKKSNLPCPFFLEASAPKQKSKTTTARSTVRPKSRAGSKQPQPAPSDTSSSHSDDDSQPEPAPLRQSKRSRTTSMMSTAKEKDTSDTLRRSTRSSRAKPPAEVEDTSSGTEFRRSTSGRGRSKSLAKTKAKEPIEVIEEADEDEAPRAAQPKKRRVKGKENVAQDVKVQKTSRKTKSSRINDTDDESRQPKHDRIAPITEDESASDQPDDADAEGLPHTEKAAPPKHLHKPRVKPEAIQDSDGASDEEPERPTEQITDSPRHIKFSKGKLAAKTADVPTPVSDGGAPEAPGDIVDMTLPSPPARLARSPTPRCQPREESPATPPPASSSLLSVSSMSLTRTESHTDAETLVEPLPLQVNGTQLTEDERLMTVEEWIRQEIEVHYERLRRDGEMKIKLFKERAEEVRQQIESL